MKLSSLSLLYVALSAFVAAAFLVVHISHAETRGPEQARPFSLTGALSEAVTQALVPQDGIGTNRTVQAGVRLGGGPSMIEM